MSNLSYCRFENTLNDLRNCRSALEESNSDELEALSPSEFNSLTRLIELCGEIYHQFEPFPTCVLEED